MFNFSASSLWASMLWGALGSGFCAYGWKQKSTVPLWGGLFMVGVSYFISSALSLSLAEVVILSAMYWCHKQGFE